VGDSRAHPDGDEGRASGKEAGAPNGSEGHAGGRDE
jgi:hypothetical protein